MKIQFTKMQALGNDFVIIDATRQNVSLTRQQLVKWASRNYGIGFDQCLIIEHARDTNSDYFCRIFNADGSEAGQCGNGARCIARFLQDRHETGQSTFKLATAATRFQAHVHADHSVTIAMSPPRLHPQEIPFNAKKQALSYKIKLGDVDAVKIQALSLGNPHAVLMVEDIAEAPMSSIGAALSKHTDFPNGINVEFVQIINRNNINVRVYERGVGETLACGSGACAAVVAGRLNKKLDATVTANLPGGALKITWEDMDSPVQMTGPAEYVFQGVIET